MPLTFSDRVRRALKKEPLNIKHLKKLASMEEGSSIIAIAIFYAKCSVETIRVLIKEGCGDVNGKYLDKNALEWAWEWVRLKGYNIHYNIFDVLLQSGTSELSISKLNYDGVFSNAERNIKIIIIILRYFPHQIIGLLKYSISYIEFLNKYKETFTTKQIELLEFLFEKGFQFRSSRLLDDDYREPLDNIFNNIIVNKNVIKNSQRLFPIELDPWIKKFDSLMKYKKNVEPKLYPLYKVRMVYQAHFVKEHFYKKDPSSIDYLPTPLKNRIDQLPQVKYTVEGVSAYPGGEMEKNGMNPKTILQQEIIYQVANMKIQDIFQELLGYFKM